MSAAPRLPNALKFKVVFKRGGLAGQSMTFQKPVVEIGRGTENDLILINDLRASRHHAEIRWNGQDLQIFNKSSKNYIAVNGQHVESAKLAPGSVVTIGETEFWIEFENETSVLEPKTKLVKDPGGPVVVQMPRVSHPPPQPLLQPQAPPARPPYYSSLPSPAPGPRPRTHRPPPRPRRGADSGGRARFYGVILILGLFFAWLMNSNGVKKKELSFRSTEQIKRDLEASQEELKEFEARKERLDSLQYRRAQENYIRGFRDYKQGNYGRAKESFQVVLNLDPDNELAKRYYQLARLKFDERVKFHMLQGNRYREKKNWRMCKASYFNVMTMVNNNQDPVFKEAKQFYDQCSLAQEGRY